MEKVFFDSDKVLAVFTDRADGDFILPENRAKLLEKLGIRNLAWMDQVHSKNVKVITEEGEVAETDGIITAEKDLVLVVMVADCIPILFYDAEQNIVAAIHVGRPGIFKKIIPEILLKMVEDFNSNPEDIQVSLGPSLQACCYEYEDGFLDSQLIIKKQLLELGDQEKNIEVSDICTKCNSNYFSYRRHKETGRFAGLIMLK